MTAPDPGGGPCLNCGTRRVGPYCHVCGQGDVDPEAGVGALVAESVREGLSWDHRVGRTVRALLTAPGAVSVAWADGRRASFVAPIRLFLVLGAILVGLGWIQESVQDPAPDTASEAETSDRSAATSQNAGYWVGRTIGRLGVYGFLLFVPLVGIAYAGLFRGRRRGLAPHLVHALHVCCFAVTGLIAWRAGRIGWLLTRGGGMVDLDAVDSLLACGFVVLAGYTALSIRRFYRTSRLGAVLAAPLVVGVPVLFLGVVVLGLYVARILR